MTVGPLVKLWRKSAADEAAAVAPKRWPPPAQSGRLSVGSARRTRRDGRIAQAGHAARFRRDCQRLRGRCRTKPAWHRAGFTRSLVALSGDISAGEPPPGNRVGGSPSRESVRSRMVRAKILRAKILRAKNLPANPSGCATRRSRLPAMPISSWKLAGIGTPYLSIRTPAWESPAASA